MGEKLAKFNAVGFSVGVVIALTTFFLFAIGVILYFYWGDPSAVKDALSTTASFFGGFATLGAAVIAAYLFNDWRDQHNKAIVAEVAKQVLVTVNDDLNYVTKLTGFLRGIPPNTPLLHNDINERIIQEIKALLDNGKKTSTQTLILFELTKNKELEARRVGYHQGLIELSHHIHNIVADNNNVGFLLRYIDSNLPNFLIHNKNYKVEIVGFILAKE